MRWLLSRVLTPLDLRFRGTRFAPSTFAGPGVPLCYLTTTGRRSGEPRTVPLLYATLLAGEIAVVATNFGRDDHPAWSHNLEAEPRAALEIDGDTRTVIARRATEAESEAIWARFEHIWPAYEQYREIAPRDIRSFVLEPSDDPAEPA